MHTGITKIILWKTIFKNYNTNIGNFKWNMPIIKTKI
jgi:hypothetical protein